MYIAKRGIYHPALFILYAPLRSEVRRRAITQVTGVIKPTAEAVSAVIILLGAELTGPRRLNYFIFCIIVVWIYQMIEQTPHSISNLDEQDE